MLCCGGPVDADSNSMDWIAITGCVAVAWVVVSLLGHEREKALKADVPNPGQNSTSSKNAPPDTLDSANHSAAPKN